MVWTDSRLARPGTAGDDRHARFQRFFDGFALLIGQFKVARILPAVEEELDMGLHGQGLHGCHVLDAPGNIIFFFIGFRRIDIDDPLEIGRTELAHFDSFLQDIVQPQASACKMKAARRTSSASGMQTWPFWVMVCKT